MLPNYNYNAMLDFSPITNAMQTNRANAMADEKLGMEREKFGMHKQQFEADQQLQKVKRWGMQSKVIDDMPDGPQKQAFAQKFWTANQDLAAHVQSKGIDPTSPQVWKILQAEAGQYDPMKEKQAQAAINASNASAALHNAQTGNVGRTGEINEYEYAKKGGYAGAFEDWQRTQANKNASQAVTWGQNDKGEWVPMQATRAGELMPSKLPEGVKAVPGDVLAYRKASATEQGEAAGKATVNLPAVEASAKMINDAIDAVENHPVLSRMTGWSGNLPNVTPAARDAQAKIDQVQGKVFLQAFDSLRGAGAITENESAGAKLAYSRLQETRVGTPEYRQALADVKREMNNLVEVARRKASTAGPSVNGATFRQPVQPPAPAAPTTAQGGWSARRLD